MPTFLFTYRAPKDYVPGGPETVGSWRAWFDQLGDKLVDIGQPVFARERLGSAATDTDLGGYSLVSADSMASAVALAEGCPFLRLGGGVEVGELTPLGADGVLANDGERSRSAFPAA